MIYEPREVEKRSLLQDRLGFTRFNRVKTSRQNFFSISRCRLIYATFRDGIINVFNLRKMENSDYATADTPFCTFNTDSTLYTSITYIEIVDNYLAVQVAALAPSRGELHLFSERGNLLLQINKADSGIITQSELYPNTLFVQSGTMLHVVRVMNHSMELINSIQNVEFFCIASNGLVIFTQPTKPVLMKVSIGNPTQIYQICPLVNMPCSISPLPNRFIAVASIKDEKEFFEIINLDNPSEHSTWINSQNETPPNAIVSTSSVRIPLILYATDEPESSARVLFIESIDKVQFLDMDDAFLSASGVITKVFLSSFGHRLPDGTKSLLTAIYLDDEYYQQWLMSTLDLSKVINDPRFNYERYSVYEEEKEQKSFSLKYTPPPEVTRTPLQNAGAFFAGSKHLRKKKEVQFSKQLENRTGISSDS